MRTIWLVRHARFSTKQLVALARTWRMAWNEARPVDASAYEFADGPQYRSLLSSEFRASNGLTIAPVSNPSSLRTVGELQDLCLAKSHFAQYDRACRQGQAYLVVVRQKWLRKSEQRYKWKLRA